MKSTRSYVILIFAIASSLTTLFAQVEYQVRQLTPEDGLSQVTILDLVFDQRGFLWVSTQDGIDRFDGRIFKPYKANQQEKFSMPSDEPTQMVEDHKGRIWIGTERSGLSYYDDKIDGFRDHKLSDATSFIADLYFSQSEKSLYVGTQDEGLFVLNLEGDSISQVQLPKYQINAISSSNEGILVGAIDGKILILTAGTGVLQEFLNVEGAINCFYATDSNIYIGTSEGLFQYNEKAKDVRKIELESEQELLTKHVKAFLAHNETQFWIATGNGLFLYDLILKKSVQKISIENSNGQSLSNNTIHSLARISKDIIAVGTAKNLNILDFTKPHFNVISHNKSGRQVLNDNVIFSIIKDGNDLWVGTTDGGVNLLRDGKPFYFYQSEDQGKEIEGTVRTIRIDYANNRLWIATTRGLHMLPLPLINPTSARFISFINNPSDSNSISGNFMKDMDIDSQGTVWGATYGNGVFALTMLHNGNYEVRRFSASNNEQPIVNNFCQSIKCYKDEVWVGTEGGLTQIVNNEVINFVHDPQNPYSLSQNSVYDILFDDQDTMWVACRNGINKYLGAGRFHNWTDEPSHPKSIIYSVQNDLAGNLWMGSKASIIKFDPQSERFVSYGLNDGIQNNEFDLHARFRDKEGVIYLGGIDGITYFNPSDLNNIDIMTPLYFSGLTVNGASTGLEFAKQHLNAQNIKNATEMRLTRQDFPFSLNFSTNDFRKYKNIQFGYRLSNNDEWSILDEDDQQILFMSLPMGKNVLEINGFSRGEKWDGDPLRMNIKVLPPWWLRWWAIVTYLLIIANIIYVIYKHQLNNKLLQMESKRLKELDQLKNDLYANITHEFRTPLTVILGLSEKIKYLQTTEDVHNDVELIQTNGERLLKLVNEILDLSKLEDKSVSLQNTRSNIVDFVAYVVESLSTLADQKSIDLVYYPEQKNIVVDFDQEKLITVLVNLISNAIKFTDKGGKIIVHVSVAPKHNKQHLLLKINDNGQGIPADDLPKIFEKYYQAKNKKVGTRSGSGIGLAITQGLVNLMNGEISVSSEVDVGTTFSIFLPITQIASLEQVQSVDIRQPLILRNESIALAQVSEEDKINLLLVEDNMDVASYIISCLVNFHVIHAKDGEEGLKLAEEHIPEIIISDVMMPGMDGFQLCKALKSDSKTDHIPIILLTARAEQKDKVFGISQGADAYILKPFSKVELLTRINQLLQSRRRLLRKIQDQGISSFIRQKQQDPQLIFLQSAIKHIHDNLNNADFNNHKLAKLMLMSESQLYKKLKAASGKSTALFIRSIRLEEAKQMLMQTDLSISEVAYDTGFSDPSWFSRAFKQEYGISPSEVNAGKS